MAIKRIGPGFEFDKSIAAYKKFQQDAPKVIANESKNHFLEGFRKGGGQTDDSKGGWRQRESTAKRNSGRAILVDTGALRRSISVLKATFKEIIIASTGIQYAARHNEGITDKKGRKMPKREFIGDSKDLNEKNKKTMAKLLAKVFKV
jgi:phage gpG-like protein